MKYIKLFCLLVLCLLLYGCGPKEVSITFIGADGEVISQQVIQKGTNILYPDDPYLEGYEFVGWDKTFIYAEEDMIINAMFEKFKYTVSFYDQNKNLVEEQIVEHGDDAVPPMLELSDDYILVKWDKDYTNVTQDLKIYPRVEKAKFEVIFKDSYGEIIDVQIVKNGEDAVAPEAPIVDGYEFVNWDREFVNVKKNLVISPVYKKIDMGYDMQNVNYWIQVLGLKYDMNKLILTPAEIENYNKKIVSDFDKTRTLDITTVESTTTGSYVKGLIEKYKNINNYDVYNNDTKKVLTSVEKNDILNNRNMDAIPTNINVKYGIIVNFAWMRTYPTKHYSQTYSMDRFQETTLNVGEGVAIYHESKDGNWYFVQAMNYYGWVEKQYIAECDYDVMKDFLKPANKLVVISDYVKLEDAHVRMGQAFPLIAEAEETYKIKFPKRNSDGTLYLKELTLAKTDDYSNGYLKYNYKNLMQQAFKLLGIEYSWGDKETAGRDCSSTMAAIYNSFGFMMPRNCTQQRYIPGYGLEVSGVTDNTMKTLYKPGTLIYSSSHVMMYLGENDYGVSYLLHNTNANDAGCILQALSSYGGHKIIGILKMQN